jgi:hypothetical protein
MNYYLYGYCAEYINLSIDYSKLFINYVSELFSFSYKQVTANTLVFFDKNPTPYFSSFLDLKNNNNGVIVWKYDLNKKLFYQYDCYTKDTKKYPIMTAFLEISDDSSKETIYLDDFLNTIYIDTSNFSYPSLQQLMEVWSYTTGIVLNRNNKINFVYIDLNANEVSLDISKDDFSF